MSARWRSSASPLLILAVTHSNLGIALERQGRYIEALTCYEQALALNPDFAEAHLNRSHALLPGIRRRDSSARKKRAIGRMWSVSLPLPSAKGPLMHGRR
jgi:tetratricopeptide (TPR) repeat protein